MAIYLRVKFASGVKKLYPITKKCLKLGRNEDNHIVIDDGKASGNHCEIHVKERKIIAVDCDSKNGTLLNGNKIKKEQIYLDDALQIGGSNHQARS